jgi:hypothetical protein
VICFRCGQSSLPLDDSGPGPSESKRPRRAATAKTVNIDSGRTIVSCDYCDLHWHFDCLDPPMMTLPSSHRKWMCPAHAEHVVVRLARYSVYCLFTTIDSLDHVCLGITTLL